MWSNRINIVILNCLVLGKIFVVVVDAFLTVDFGVAQKSTIALPSSSSLVSTSRRDHRFLSSTVMFSSSSSEEKQCVDDDQSKNKNKNRKKKALYVFSEARKIARGHGFSDKEEFFEYDCAGAYQLPKNAHEVWSEEWTSWENFLGVPFKDFEEAREVARTRVGVSSTTEWKVSTEEEYRDLFSKKEISDGDIASRLPYRPDLKYKNKGWVSWEDFLSSGEE